MVNAYPLQWPEGFEKTHSNDRLKSSFKVTADFSRKDLLKEIELLSGDKSPILSSNVPLRRRDGQMYADIASDDIPEPGVAIYFMFKGRQTVLACDAWITPGENMRALALTVNALRGLNRWACSEMLSRVFTGFKALAAPSSPSCWDVLGLVEKPDKFETVSVQYKRLAIKLHPDMPKGNIDKFIKLKEAFEQAKTFYN